MHITYRSKTDAWLVLVILGTTVLPMFLVMHYAFSWIPVLVIVLLLVIGLVPVFSIRYVIGPDTLTVKCCFFMRKTYAIADITAILPTRTVLSAPAASLDRLSIRLRNTRKPLIVSPKHKAAFIGQLVRRNPQIRIADELRKTLNVPPSE